MKGNGQRPPAIGSARQCRKNCLRRRHRVTQLPGIDLTLGIPTAIVAIIRALPLVGPIAAGQLQETGAALPRAVLTRPFVSQAETARPDEDNSADFREPLRPYTGLDGVYIEPGPSWLRTPR